jgi:hypothetical protein
LVLGIGQSSKEFYWGHPSGQRAFRQLKTGWAKSHTDHGRACPGHLDQILQSRADLIGMRGSSPRMTEAFYTSKEGVDDRMIGEQSEAALRTAMSSHDYRSVSDFDSHFPVLQFDRIGFDRHHAGRQDHFAGTDIELAIVEIALDYVTFDIALRQRTGPVGAGIVGDVEFAVDIEYRERQIVDLDLDGSAGRDLVGAAQFDTF